MEPDDLAGGSIRRGPGHATYFLFIGGSSTKLPQHPLGLT